MARKLGCLPLTIEGNDVTSVDQKTNFYTINIRQGEYSPLIQQFSSISPMVLLTLLTRNSLLKRIYSNVFREDGILLYKLHVFHKIAVV